MTNKQFRPYITPQREMYWLLSGYVSEQELRNINESPPKKNKFELPEHRLVKEYVIMFKYYYPNIPLMAARYINHPTRFDLRTKSLFSLGEGEE